MNERVDFVIPVFNEQDGLPRFHELLTAAVRSTQISPRFIYINDGSADATSEVLAKLAAGDPAVSLIELSRNFGHQAAISAGLDRTDADVVIMMDGDGEHPPSLIPEMLRQFRSGYDIVQAQRIDSADSSGIFKRTTSRLFYSLISAIGEIELVHGASDFRLLAGDALRAMKSLGEYHKFYRGMTSWIGFRTVILPYHPEKRIAGRSSYSLRKMLRLASDGLFSFSLTPLRIGLLLGVLFIGLATAEVVFVAVVWFRDRAALVPGWSSLILIVTLGSAINMFLQGILGIYIGMIFQEVKRRPVYLVRQRQDKG